MNEIDMLKKMIKDMEVPFKEKKKLSSQDILGIRETKLSVFCAGKKGILLEIVSAKEVGIMS